MFKHLTSALQATLSHLEEQLAEHTASERFAAVAQKAWSFLQSLSYEQLLEARAVVLVGEPPVARGCDFGPFHAYVDQLYAQGLSHQDCRDDIHAGLVLQHFQRGLERLASA